MRVYQYLFIAAIGFISCSKKLDRAPYNAIPNETAFDTQVDFGNAIRGMYTGMLASPTLGPAAVANFYGEAWIVDPDILSDNAIFGTAGRGSRTIIYNWQYSGNATSNMFTDGYIIIRRANAILANLDKLPAGAFKTNAQGEALAVRALIHFDMARMFTKTYTQAGASDLGLPYVTSLDPTAKPSRGTVRELYDKLTADMEAAEPLINASNGVGRLNKSAVAGLLSRIYLYRGEWQKCVDAATRALAVTNNPGSLTEFPTIWTDQTEAGVLFKLKLQNNDGVPLGNNWSQSTVANGTRSEYVADYSFFQLFQNNDVRKTAYIRTSAFGGFNFNHIAKYFGRPGGGANIVDVKIIRVAEVLLNRAEAYYMLGGANEALALADLNRLRSNRYTGFASPNETGTALLNAIHLERRLELAFESDRFFDLKRRGLGVNRSNFGDYADGTGRQANFKVLTPTDHRLQLPLPQSEINLNPNMQQNPGY